MFYEERVDITRTDIFSERETMFKSLTYGKLDIAEIPDKLLAFYNSHKQYDAPFQIMIGTDSQTYEHATHFVNVICICCEGKGGIFFHQDEKVSMIRDVRTKLYKETQDSLSVADALVALLAADPKYEEIFLNCPIRIDIDAGNSDKGKTKDLIAGICGWVGSLGWDYAVKPYSTAASSIADKFSKKSGGLGAA